MQEYDSDSDNSITMDDIEDCACLLKRIVLFTFEENNADCL